MPPTQATTTTTKAITTTIKATTITTQATTTTPATTTTTTTTPTTPAPNPSLSTGSAVGIAFGVILGLLAFGIGGYLFKTKYYDAIKYQRFDGEDDFPIPHDA